MTHEVENIQENNQIPPLNWDQRHHGATGYLFNNQSFNTQGGDFLVLLIGKDALERQFAKWGGGGGDEVAKRSK